MQTTECTLADPRDGLEVRISADRATVIDRFAGTRRSIAAAEGMRLVRQHRLTRCRPAIEANGLAFSAR